MAMPDNGLDSTIPHAQCDPEAAEAAARAAGRDSRRPPGDCLAPDRSKEEAVPRIFLSELRLGELLGAGSFGNVYEVEGIDIRRPEVSTAELRLSSSVRRQLRSRELLAEREESGEPPRYAVKFLRREVMADARKFRIGAADLVSEAKMLSSLDHPNIVKIRGVSAEGVHGFATGLEGGYFIMMDRLYGTLEKRIGDWRERRGGIGRLLDVRGRRRRGFFAERLLVALDIAGALRYLHGRHIIYRDLKPENVGYDARGDVKIFDFGLARRINPRKVLEDGTYKLSGNTGSLRYMAPEVALSQTYNLTADVYSFGTLLWEMSALKKPYEGFSRKMYTQTVVLRGWRPEIDRDWPQQLQALIDRSWSPFIYNRPNMKTVCDILQRIITDLGKGKGASGRSTQISPVATPPGMATPA